MFRTCIRRQALFVVLVVVLLATAAPAFASPSALESKKAERAQALAELEAMQHDLSVEVANYVRIGRQIQQAREEASRISSQVAEIEARLVVKEDALVERAVELYRGDRVALVFILLDAESATDLFNRIGYLLTISQRDAFLIQDVRLARSESLWLQQGMTDQLRMLSDLQYSAAAQRSKIESDIAAQQKRADELGRDVERLLAEERMRLVEFGSVPAGSFNPDLVIADAVFSDSKSMSVEDIQAFLDKQPGTLKSYVGVDHLGVRKSAAAMISEAAVEWGVNPKVILVTLQKEQSLLERAHPTQRAYDWAMGCGKMDSRTIGSFAGFGNQVWSGARILKKHTRPWSPGDQMKIDGSTVSPMSGGTRSLYKYTPHFHGVMSFWRLYWRYFGDPLAPPAVAA